MNRIQISISILILTLLAAIPAAGQGTGERYEISGRILDSDTNQSLPGVHIFLDQTQIGTVSGPDGEFTIQNIPAGTYTLVTSMIGYNLLATNLPIPERSGRHYLIRMSPAVHELPELLVQADRPEEWFRHLAQFTNAFLGITENAERTEIENPEILEFRQEGDRLIAETDYNPLILTNRGLGYRIEFYLNRVELDDNRLDTFGYARYRELSPSDDDEFMVWQERRNDAYHGSFRHFIQALNNQSLEEEGFFLYYATTSDNVYRTRRVNRLVRRDSVPDKIYSSHEIMQPAQNQNQIHLVNPVSEFIGVIFVGGRTDIRASRQMRQQGFRSDWQISFIELPLAVAVIEKRTGNYHPPYRPVLSGYWSWTSRIPDLLSDDYSPGETIQD